MPIQIEVGKPNYFLRKSHFGYKNKAHDYEDATFDWVLKRGIKPTMPIRLVDRAAHMRYLVALWMIFGDVLHQLSSLVAWEFLFQSFSQNERTMPIRLVDRHPGACEGGAHGVTKRRIRAIQGVSSGENQRETVQVSGVRLSELGRGWPRGFVAIRHGDEDRRYRRWWNSPHNHGVPKLLLQQELCLESYRTRKSNISAFGGVIQWMKRSRKMWSGFSQATWYCHPPIRLWSTE